MKQRYVSRGDLAVDRQLGIETCGIEEWEGDDELYHRFESTSYRALDSLWAEYMPLEDACLLDYGCGLGRVNFYAHHQLGLGGYGLEVHADRVRRAKENLRGYVRHQGVQADIRFIETMAEKHIPAPETSLFYFFNPFDVTVFEIVLKNILDSLVHRPRIADLVLYYPSWDYLEVMGKQDVFKPLLLVDLSWSSDPRDYFMVYRVEK